MSVRSRLLFSVSLGLAAVGALAWAASASAKTLGSVAPPNVGGCTSCDGFQAKTDPASPKYRVPKGPTGLWTITAWSAQGGGFADGTAQIRIYRRTSTPGQFELVRESSLETVPADQHPLFSTSLKVRRGDLLGLHTTSAVPLGYSTSFVDDLEKLVNCDPTGVGQLVGKGTTCPLVNSSFDLINVTAQLTPR